MIWVKLKKNSFLSLPSKLFLITIIILPASGFFEIKISLFFVGVICFFFFISTNSFRRKEWGNFIKFFFYLSMWFSFLLFLLLISYLKPGDDEYHFRSFLSYSGFILSFFFTVFAVRLRFIPYNTFLKIVIYSNFLYMILKTILVLLPSTGLFSVRDIKEFLKIFIGSVVYEFWDEGALIARISFGNDIISPFILSFMLADPYVREIVSNSFRRLFIFFALVAGAFSFTRYIWVVDFFVVIFYLILIRANIFLILLLFIVFFSFYLGVQYIDWLSEIIEIRFGDIRSLDVKGEQTDFLLMEGQHYFFLGKGIGGYVKDYIRSFYQPYLYEVQWAALFMQIGLIGLSVVIVGLFSITGSSVFKTKRNNFSLKERIYFGFIYILWLFSGFTNPYLFIMSSSIIYLMFYFGFRNKELH